MGLKTEKRFQGRNLEKIFIYDEDKPKEKHLTFQIDHRKKTILFLPRDPKFLKKLILHGFDRLPSEFNEKKGYVKGGTFYYLEKKAEQIGIKNVVIIREGSTSIGKKGGQRLLSISYPDFQRLKRRLSSLNNDHKINKSNFVDGFFHDLFPRKFKKGDKYAEKRSESILSGLDKSLIERLKPRDIEKVLDFFQDLISSKYKSSIRRRNLFHSTKVKIDDIAISKIIEEFEDLLSKNVSEETWGKYLEKNLFLLDSKYIKVIPQLNVVLATYRKVDFGLVDTQGYLDIFEIKKPRTPLLSRTTDRGNFYWSTAATKALVQAEKYLFNAENKASNLAQDIQREKNIVVEIIRPRAMVLMGSSKQLKSKKQKDDFRILRQSLKNIEVILYDELLERIKAQKGKIYIG